MSIELARDPREPEKPAEPDRTPLAEVAIPCMLAWLVPGAGHFYLGRRRRALLFFAIVLITFILGLALDGRTYVYDAGHPLTYLATFANVGLGPLDLIGREMTYDRLVWRLPSPPSPLRNRLLIQMREKVESPLNEYGTTYLMTACLMNILLILDAFDIAMGRKVAPGPSPPP